MSPSGLYAKTGGSKLDAAVCRMRMDHKNENVNMFDLIAYRIKFIPHPKVRIALDADPRH